MTERNSFEVWFLCTGNRFRSPLAEHVLRRRLSGQGISIRSRGTLDVGSAPALPEALELSRTIGLDLTEHRAQVLRRGELVDADLAIGFERAHLGPAVEVGGAARNHTYTLPELVTWLDTSRSSVAAWPECARASIAAAAAGRDHTPVAWPLEIEDPLGGTPERFRNVLGEIMRLCEKLAERLEPAPD